MTARISVIIPTFNRAEMVCRCVQSVLATDWPSYEVIVVDDCSPDDTGKLIFEHFGKNEHVKYFRNAKNKQLGGSRNVGASMATGEYLLFLDDDNLILPDMISRIVSDFENYPDLHFIAPMEVNVGGTKDGKIWTLGSDFNRWTSQPDDYLPNIPLEELPKDNIRFKTSYSPNSFAVRKKDHDSVLGFCEELPFYYDDADYAWRILKATNGQAWILSTAVTHHQNFLSKDDCLALRELGVNTTRRAFLLARNRLRFARRHFNFIQILSVTFVFAPLSAVYYGLVAIRNRRPDIAWSYLKGTVVGILNLVLPA